MNKIYIIEGSDGGRCRCGHRTKKGEVYMLIEGKRGNWTLCRVCFTERGMKGQRIHIDELRKKWFHDKSMADVLEEPLFAGV